MRFVCIKGKEKWWAVVNMIMNHQTPLNSEELRALQEGFCSMYLISNSASWSINQSISQDLRFWQ